MPVGQRQRKTTCAVVDEWMYVSQGFIARTVHFKRQWITPA